MRLAELRWMPFAVPFIRAFDTARSIVRLREGAFVRLLGDTGVLGVGEIAPLPSHGTLPLGDQLAAIEQLSAHLIGVEIDGLAAVLAVEAPALAPLRCAIETAALDAQAKAAGKGLVAVLAEDVATCVQVNAVIDAAAASDAATAARRAVARGFRTLKLKVGVALSPSGEVARIASVRDAVGSGIRLRLDANGAWSEVQAIETLRAVEGCAIELVEQPVAAPDLGALGRVRAAVPQLIAADESVTGPDAARTIIENGTADALVLKLPVVGGPLRAMEIAGMAKAAGVSVIVTSALDTGVGVAAALHVAAALPPTLAHGLATLDLLEDDLIDPGLPLASGIMPVPSSPGLGVAIDERALARYATREERVVRI